MLFMLNTQLNSYVLDYAIYPSNRLLLQMTCYFIPKAPRGTKCQKYILKICSYLFLTFFVFVYQTLISRVVLGLWQNRAQRDFPNTLSLHQYQYQSSTSIPTDETLLLIYDNNSKSIVYFRIHFWWCTFCGFVQLDGDMYFYGPKIILHGLVTCMKVRTFQVLEAAISLVWPFLDCHIILPPSFSKAVTSCNILNILIC